MTPSGHWAWGDFKLILETYYAQNDDARLVEEAGKIDFGLYVPEPKSNSDGENVTGA